MTWCSHFSLIFHVCFSYDVDVACFSEFLLVLKIAYSSEDHIHLLTGWIVNSNSRVIGWKDCTFPGELWWVSIMTWSIRWVWWQFREVVMSLVFRNLLVITVGSYSWCNLSYLVNAMKQLPASLGYVTEPGFCFGFFLLYFLFSNKLFY